MKRYVLLKPSKFKSYARNKYVLLVKLDDLNTKQQIDQNNPCQQINTF